MRVLLVLIALVGCRDAPRGAAPPANAVAKNTVEIAKLELSRALELDYDNPIQSKSAFQRRGRVFEMYAELCRDGDADICLFASQFPIRRPWVQNKIAANCTAGHAISCRYIEWHTDDGIDPTPLSVAEQHRACAAGVTAECEEIQSASSLEEVRFGRDTLCTLIERNCVEAAESYLQEPRDPGRARYLLELACQSLERFSCERLIRAYLTKELPEPMPHRGLALQRFACKHWGLCEQTAKP